MTLLVFNRQNNSHLRLLSTLHYSNLTQSTLLMKLNLDRLTVVNCGQNYEREAAAGAYACPADGPQGSFQNNQYMGLCWQRAVRLVGPLHGVVDIDPISGLATLLWNNEKANGLSDDALIVQARELLPLMFPQKKTVQRVFVLGDMQETRFHKDTPGGMFPRKKYLNVQCLKATTAADLAQKLNDKDWTTFCQ